MELDEAPSFGGSGSGDTKQRSGPAGQKPSKVLIHMTQIEMVRLCPLV